MTALIAKPWLFSQPDQDPRTATGARLRWGIIATGGIAAALSRDLELLADAELYAVSSRRRRQPTRSPPTTACPRVR